MDYKHGQTDSQLFNFLNANNIDIDDITFAKQYNFEKGNYILNLDSADYNKNNKNGTHWVALINKGNNIYYFDSFGFRSPMFIEDYCKKHKIKLFYNTVQFQDLSQQSCGMLCCLFLYITQRIYGRIDNKNDFNNIIDEMKYWEIKFD